MAIKKREKGKKLTATRKKTGYLVGLVLALLTTVLMWMAGAALTAPPAHAQEVSGDWFGPFATQQEQSNGDHDRVIRGGNDVLYATQQEQSNDFWPH